MATYSLRSKRGLDGRPCRPVARVKVTVPYADDPAYPIVLRLTLRSDGAVLRSLHSNLSGWSSPNVWSKPPSKPMTLDEAIALFPVLVRRHWAKRADATFIDEEV